MLPISNFWRWLTTSRYTRKLEDENAELKAKVSEYERILIPRLVARNVAEDAGRTRSVVSDVDRPDRAESGKQSRTGRAGWQLARNRLETLSNPEVSGKHVAM